MTLNIALETEQQQREQQHLEAYKAEIGKETDLYSGGFFDGLLGMEPSKPEKHSYWEGYQTGYREYWAGRLSVEIPSEF